MPATILHLSDLHRDTGSRITTPALIESLRKDRDRYIRDEHIPKPDIAIISGDIAYGVAEDSSDAIAKLESQYEEAADFLIRLAETFFAGDRERIVIVPGNHDVSLPHVLRATVVVDVPQKAEQRALVAQQYAQESSNYRWSMSELTLRRITNLEKYNRRLEPFSRFYARFYEGRRTFSLEPETQFSIHDFPAHGIVVAGFSSCHENDPYNRTGRINPDCVAGATRQISEFTARGRLAIAVWHHSLNGGPKDADYLDADILQSLIDGDIVVGMHGHQHRPQLVEHRFTANRKRGIVVLSAGTLCGGPKSLPTGRMRAYNVVVLDLPSQSGAIHVREMLNTDFSLPVWGQAHVADFSGSSLRFPLTIAERSANSFQDAAKASQLLQEGKPGESYSLVRLHLSDPFARRVATRALGALHDWNEVRATLNPPQSPEEFILLCEALDELGLTDELARLLTSDYAISTNDAGVKQCISIMRRRRGVR